jgi:cytidine deaminase
MIEKTVTIKLSVYDRNQVDADAKRIIDAAFEITRNAYAPYSGFSVGAALLLANGEIVTGCNQENAAYPSGLCAERVALFSAGAHYPNVAVKQMAIVALKDGQPVAVAPCGACRQVILESLARQTASFPVYLAEEHKVTKVENAGDLLPLAFGPDSL